MNEISDLAIDGRVERVAIHVAETPLIEVGPGCYRRDLAAVNGARHWVVSMAPGSEWPYVDDHPAGESYYVLEGEIIEAADVYGAGTFVHFSKGSRHRPRTERGVRILGSNPIES